MFELISKEQKWPYFLNIKFRNVDQEEEKLTSDFCDMFEFMAELEMILEIHIFYQGNNQQPRISLFIGKVQRQAYVYGECRCKN